jgi:hypothetical protein
MSWTDLILCMVVAAIGGVFGALIVNAIKFGWSDSMDFLLWLLRIKR